jgi:hypothetical protein
VSRFTSGIRSLTLEEAIVLCAALGVPLSKLLDGDDDAVLVGQPVPLGQVRDVLAHGSVVEHSGDTVLDRLSDAVGGAHAPLADRIASELGCTPREVDLLSMRLWSLPAAEEVERRVDQSWETATGTTRGLPSVFMLNRPDERRVRGWRGLHAAAVTEDLREAFADRSRTKRKA